MAPPWEPYAYNNAKFLVDIFPEIAIEILEGDKFRAAVDERVDRICMILGPQHTVKALVQERQWGQLQDLKDESRNNRSSSSPAMTPNVRPPLNYRHNGQRLPSTPSSMASDGLLKSQRLPSSDFITVHHGVDQFPLSVAYSHLDICLIGEDKLDRFDDTEGLKRNWCTTSRKVNLGGQILSVGQYVDLTWSLHGESGTKFTKFWVVPAGSIQFTDALLGNGKGLSPETRAPVAESKMSPMTLNPHTRPPNAPSPPRQAWQYSASSGIHSYDSSPPTSHRFDQRSSHRDTTPQGRAPPGTYAHTDTTSSGPPSIFSTVSRQSPPTTVRPPSRPDSAQSSRTAKAPRSDSVMVKYSFNGIGNKLVVLNLSKHGGEILAYLQKNLPKSCVGAELGNGDYEMIVTSVAQGSSPQEYSIDPSTFDQMWEAVVDFINSNRLPGSSQGEFHIDIQ